MNSFIYTNSQFVGVGYSFYTSSDGYTWSKHGTLLRNDSTYCEILSSVSFGMNTFIAVGQKGTIVQSIDGKNWNRCNSGVSANLRKVVYLSDQFIAIGDSGTIVTSRNGIDWFKRTTNTTEPISSIVSDGNTFVTRGCGFRSIRHPIPETIRQGIPGYSAPPEISKKSDTF